FSDANAGPTPVALGPNPFSFDNVIQRWQGNEPVNNPVVAADANVASQTDPVSGRSTPAAAQDTMVGKAVYVAWNTSTQNSNRPNGIRIMGSADGGQTFSTPVWATDRGPTNQVVGGPQIVFTQPSADGGVEGGHLVIAWTQGSAVIVDTSRP